MEPVATSTTPAGKHRAACQAALLPLPPLMEPEATQATLAGKQAPALQAALQAALLPPLRPLATNATTTLGQRTSTAMDATSIS